VPDDGVAPHLRIPVIGIHFEIMIVIELPVASGIVFFVSLGEHIMETPVHGSGAACKQDTTQSIIN